MNILIVEFASSGHHVEYLSNVVEILTRLGHSVRLAIPIRRFPPELIDRWIRQCSQVRDVDGIAVDRAFAARSLIARDVAFWKNLRRVFKSAESDLRVDFVFLPYVDYCVYALATLGSPFDDVKWSGIAMRPSFHHSHFGIGGKGSGLALRVKQWLFRRLLVSRHLACLIVIDELLVKFYQHDVVGQKITLLRDPGDSRCPACAESARGMLKWPKDAQIALVYGSIDMRKGVDELVRVALTECTDLHLVIAGRQSAGFKQHWQTSPERDRLIREGRLWELDEYVSAEKAALLFSASDIVWLAYRNHAGMSGVLVQAAQSRRPVVVAPGGLMAYHVESSKIGVVLKDGMSAGAAITAALAMSVRENKFDAFTWRNAELVIQEVVGKSLGIEPKTS